MNMRRRDFLASTIGSAVVAASGCSQAKRRPKRPKPPPADIDYEADFLPVVLEPSGGSHPWTDDRLEVAFAMVSAALAQAKIKTNFLSPDRVTGPDSVDFRGPEMEQLQRDAWVESGSLVMVHFVNHLVSDGKEFGGVAWMPWNPPGYIQNGIVVSARSIPSTLIHEIGHHLGLEHAWVNSTRYPLVPASCATQRDDCDTEFCGDNAMSYCGPEREPTGDHSFTEEQEGCMRYWALVRQAFREVSTSAMMSRMTIQPKFDKTPTATICAG